MTSTLEVSGQRLRANVRAIDHTLADAVAPSDGRAHPALLGVIKANGYGAWCDDLCADPGAGGSAVAGGDGCA